VRHALLDRSSGDAALDEQGGRFLLLTRMLIPADKTPPAKDRLVWVTASIEFGNDVQFPRPAGERAP